MGRIVDVDDLVDAREVAAILGLSQPSSVHVYAQRYPDMPPPVVDRGPNRARFWLRGEIKAWARLRFAEQ